MSLRGKLQSKLDGAWRKLDDVPVPNAIVRHVVSREYDTDQQKPVETVEDYPCTVILDTLTEDESIRLSGGKGQYSVLIRIHELPMIPVVDDRVIIDGENYYIEGTDTDPARVLFTGYCSKRGGIDSGLG